jgi:dTDP-4-dehydrorhamnose reductase
MPKVAWVTGAGGLIGSHIVRHGREVGRWEVRALTRAQIDLCDLGGVTRAFQSERPELIIHCAAISQSPACDADPERAWRINVEATAHLAGLALQSQFIFFSTDLVFDGALGHYDESSTPNPLSVYGRSKVAAENLVLANPKHTVVRTSLTAGNSPTADRSVNEQLCLAWGRGQKTRLFTDEYRCPIGAPLTARAVWELADLGRAGVYHVAGAQRLSRFEIGRLIAARHPKPAPQIEPASLREYRGSPRAPDTSLNCGKVQQLLSFRLPGFEEWLASQPCCH